MHPWPLMMVLFFWWKVTSIWSNLIISLLIASNQLLYWSHMGVVIGGYFAFSSPPWSRLLAFLDQRRPPWVPLRHQGAVCIGPGSSRYDWHDWKRPDGLWPSSITFENGRRAIASDNSASLPVGIGIYNLPYAEAFCLAVSNFPEHHAVLSQEPNELLTQHWLLLIANRLTPAHLITWLNPFDIEHGSKRTVLERLHDHLVRVIQYINQANFTLDCVGRGSARLALVIWLLNILVRAFH